MKTCFLKVFDLFWGCILFVSAYFITKIEDFYLIGGKIISIGPVEVSAFSGTNCAYLTLIYRLSVIPGLKNDWLDISADFTPVSKKKERKALTR